MADTVYNPDVMERHSKFSDALDTDKVYTVYKPLPEKVLKELEMIREVSTGLQKKKNEDIKIAADARAADTASTEDAKKATEAQDVQENS